MGPPLVRQERRKRRGAAAAEFALAAPILFLFRFVGVAITQATGSGSNMNISVQPVATLDPTVNYDPSTVVPAGEGPSSTTSLALPKFTQ